MNKVKEKRGTNGEKEEGKRKVKRKNVKVKRTR